MSNGIVKARPNNHNLVDPTTIGRMPGWNPRIDFGDIEALAAQIEQQSIDGHVVGLINPLRIRRAVGRSDGKVFDLIDGDRRLTAIELLLSRGVAFPEGVPAIISDAKQPEQQMLVQMLLANEGKPFTPIEEAQAYRRMKESGMTLEAICKAVGRSHVHVGYTLALLDAAPEVVAAVVDGTIGATTAKEVIKAAGRKNKHEQAAMVASIKEAPKGKKGQRARVVLAKAKSARQQASGKEVKQRTAIRSAEAIQKQCERLVKHWEAIKSAESFTDKDLAGYVDAVADDGNLTPAFVAGAIEALKYVMGMDVNLEI